MSVVVLIFSLLVSFSAFSNESCEQDVSIEVTNNLKKNVDLYMMAAMKYNVSPVALIGTVMSAQTFRPMQVSFIRQKRRAIGWNHSTGKSHSRKPSSPVFYGPGRLPIEYALELEEYKKGNKPKHSEESLRSYLSNNTNAIQQTARYLRHIADMFKKQGFLYVQDRADLIASLYAQGDVQQVSQQLAYDGKNPSNNEWGVFVNCNRSKVAEILKYTLNGSNVLVEKGCVYAPKSAKVSDWRYRCMTMDGTYKIDLLPGSEEELQLSSLKEKNRNNTYKN